MSRPISTAIAIAAAALLLGPATAGAETFKPTRFDDPTPGHCKPKDCSLREATMDANDNGENDKIVLGKGTYKMQIGLSSGAEAGGQSGDFNLVYPTKVVGKGPEKTKIDAKGLDRVFTLSFAGPDGITISGVTITGGDPSDGFHAVNSGGGLLVDTQEVALRNVVIRNNLASFGAGLRMAGQHLTISKSTITDNISSEGGGIDVRSALDAAQTEIVASTISGNTAEKGGGIIADGLPSSPSQVDPQVTLTNSTVADNHTSDGGGGLMADNLATIALDNSTVAYNEADFDNAGGGVGGGVWQHSGAIFTLGDSVVAGNTVGTSGTDQQCSGTFSGDGNVLIAAEGCASLGAGTNQYVGSALIGTFGTHGGPTKTVPLQASSPAIGYAVTCPIRDQRGNKRPPDCDSGSFERKKP